MQITILILEFICSCADVLTAWEQCKMSLQP